MLWKNNLSVKFLIVCCLLAATAGDCPAKKQKRTISTAQSEQKATQRRISETTRKINDNARKTEQTLNELSLLRGEINLKERQISATRQELDSLNNVIAITQDSIETLNLRLESLRATYVKALRKLQGSQYATDELGFVFSSESFSKAYARIRYIQEFSKWRKRKAAEIKAAVVAIEQQKTILAELQNKRTSSLNTLSTDQALLKARQDETGKMMAKLQRDGKNLKAALDKEKKRLKSIDDEITKMIEEERRERERQKKSKGATAPKNGKTAPGKSKTPDKPKSDSRIDNSDPDAAMTSKFASHKGSMLFPVAGPYRIVAKFGSSNGQPNNTGIEIVLDGSADCRSVFEGVVSRVFQNHDGNYSVMVRHGAYITVFYNVASLSVKAKDKVKAGQTIGRVAVDSRYGKPMLHFEVRKGSQTLDPLSWVK